jgi:hypothetical protein
MEGDVGSATNCSIEAEKRNNLQSFVLDVKSESAQYTSLRHWQAQSATEVAVVSRIMSHSPGLMVPAFWQIAPEGVGRAGLAVQAVEEGAMVEEVLWPGGL